VNWTEIARAIYGGGLLLLGGGFLYAVARLARPVRDTVRELSSAIREASLSLRETSANSETLARVEQKVNEIHAAVVKPREEDPRKDPPRPVAAPQTRPATSVGRREPEEPRGSSGTS